MLKKMLAVAAVVTLAGCACTGRMIDNRETGGREGIFAAVDDQGLPGAGYGDLHVSASIKTHSEEAFVFNSCSHGSADYTLLLDIDGQLLRLRGKASQERLEAVEINDPEEGTGCRHRFDARLRLKAGRHTVTVAIPEDGVRIAREIYLPEGATYLTIRPVYRRTAGNRRIGMPAEQAFKEGVGEIRLLIGGKEI